jgi:(p)ppGpp synthase/HD superfamily hydrolase
MEQNLLDIQSIYQRTIVFATLKHLEKEQTIPGTKIPYVVHLSNVAMEILIASQHSTDFDLNFAIQIALLHDTLEDTSATFEEIETEFGIDVAKGVSALTKNEELPKNEKMFDSLTRIKKLRREVWAVKLADRITNLQIPPQHWDGPKKVQYQQEAKIILEALQGGNQYLENRLADKISAYKNYF